MNHDSTSQNLCAEVLAVALVVVFPLLTAVFGLTSLDTLIIAYLGFTSAPSQER